MNVKKFIGATSRDALRKVREALGPDAVILSNRQADGVVEILALANDDAASLASPPAASDMAQPRPQLQTQFAVPQRPSAAPAARPAPAAEAVDMARMQQMMASALAHVKNAAAEMNGMMNEIRAMRGMMETQLAEISWGSTQQREPQKNVVLREMLAAGFRPAWRAI